MAFNEELAERVRKSLGSRADVEEKRMFGGLAFMVGGHMACGVVGDELMVRVGPARYSAALGRAHAHEMNFTGKTMRGFVMVDAAGVASSQGVRSWVQEGVSFVATLPAKR